MRSQLDRWGFEDREVDESVEPVEGPGRAQEEVREAEEKEDCSGFAVRREGAECWQSVEAGDQCGRQVVAFEQTSVSCRLPWELGKAWETRRRTSLAIVEWSCIWWRP